MLPADDQLQSIEGAEADIGDQEIRRGFAEDAAGLLEGASRDDIVPGVAEHFRQSEPGDAMIVDDQYRGHAGDTRRSTGACLVQCMSERQRFAIASTSHMPVSTAVEPPVRVRPFLKWAGGKRQLLRELRRFIPSTFRAYHEPFLGSGAVFFDLWRDGALTGRTCRLTDINPDLVGVYRRHFQQRGRGHQRAAGAGCPSSPAGQRRVLPGARRGLQPPAPRADDEGVSVSRVPGRPGGDVHLSQPDRLQRTVPAERPRRLQRAGGPLSEPAYLRRPHAAVGRRSARPTVGVAASRLVRQRRVPMPGGATWFIWIRRTRRSARPRGSPHTPAPAFQTRTRPVCRSW